MSYIRRNPKRGVRTKSRTQKIRRVSDTEADRLRDEFQAAPARSPGAEQKLNALQTTSEVTVANLPTGILGRIAVVSDATSPSVGSTVSGSGAAKALVWFNGTNWTVIGV